MRGVYYIIIKVLNNINIKVGALGYMLFNKGYYVYIGSAQNNLEKRVSRHIIKRKKKRWHIDYLTSNKNVAISKLFYKKAKNEFECKIALLLSKDSEPIKGFGCSDCKCKSHLFKLKSIKRLGKLKLMELA